MSKERPVVYISGKISAPTQLGVEANKNRMLDAAVSYATEHPDAAPYLPGDSNDRLGAQLNWEWKDYMRADLAVLKKADTIFMVDRWEESRGARMEHFLAKKWGIHILYEKPQK